MRVKKVTDDDGDICSISVTHKGDFETKITIENSNYLEPSEFVKEALFTLSETIKQLSNL